MPTEYSDTQILAVVPRLYVVTAAPAAVTPEAAVHSGEMSVNGVSGGRFPARPAPVRHARLARDVQAA